MALTARVVAGIDKVIPQNHRAEVTQLLESADFAENICLSILRLARGDAAKIPDLIRYAKRDYRDVIAWASQPSRTYIVGLLRKGPNWKTTSHLTHSRIRAWKEARKIIIGGQFVEEEDPRGLYIFTVASLDEARALTEEDPGIQAGELAFEFHRWLSADGLQVGLPAGWDI